MRRKVFVVAILIIAMILQCIMPFTTAYATTSVEITLNSNLYEAIKSQLQEKGIVAQYKDANRMIIISQDELDKVTSLNLENKEIDDLTGLNAFSKVTSLNLHANKLTVDSNLSVLDSLNLTDLDLSSNNLESVRSITTFHDIQNADITNQRFISREIVKVDDSEESESRIKTVTVSLPDILLEDGNQINPYWFIDKNGDPGDPGSARVTVNEEESEIITPSPSISFENSFLDGSTNLVLNVAEGDGQSYQALRGFLKFEIKVNDVTSKLANSEMTFYYSIVNSDETGIIFDDINLYKAVRDQLTKGQDINKELKSYNENPEKAENLYLMKYDAAQILVIDTNDIINNIPSLILNNKQIRNLKGIEEFVGLESKLNISHNYITSIEKILELEENKSKKEQELRNRYSSMLAKLKNAVQSYDIAVNNIKTAEENYNKAEKELAELTEEAAITAKRNQMSEYLSQIADYLNEKDICELLINKYEKKLFKIYEKEFKLVSLLPSNINYLSYSELMSSNIETVKGYSLAIMERIAGLEKNNGLTPFENNAIQELMTVWGHSCGIEFKTTKPIYEKVDEQIVITGYEPLENPISEFFEDVKKDEALEIKDYENFVYLFKCIDTLSQIENYYNIKNMNNKKEVDGEIVYEVEDYFDEALAYITNLYQSKELDSYFYDNIIKDSKIYNDLIDDAIAINPSSYDKSYFEQYEIILAHKLSVVTDSDIAIYITLPRVKELNLEYNNVCSLKDIDKLTELKVLNAYKNKIDNISDVNWSGFIGLQELNLGYNQISEIKPLEVLTSLIDLNLSSNLLEGSFTFNLLNMRNLTNANFSNNQYSDIRYAHDQYIMKAIAQNKTVLDCLKEIKLNFNYQTISMSTTMIKTDEEFVELELPLIFRQLEEYDSERTSFGIDSLGGLVEEEGYYAKVRVPGIGTYKAIVNVDGKNGNGYTSIGLGYGTTCTIEYTVVDNVENTEESNTGEQPQPEQPENPLTPGEIEHQGNIQLGYPIRNGYLCVYTPKISLQEFSANLVDLDKYDVKITQNESDKIATGAVVTVTSKEDESIKEIIEVVVKGDVNGDGNVQGLDSGKVRGVWNDSIELVGSYKEAADVNDDNRINMYDSIYILNLRAEYIANFIK